MYNYEVELFDKYNGEYEELANNNSKPEYNYERREAPHIAFDKVYDGISYHHTGYEVWTGCRWWNEYQSNEGKIILA